MRHVFAVATLLILTLSAIAQREYGFDNRKASGQPYLTPEETVKRMKVAPEFEVKLFAGEPQVVNPVAFTIDEKGRIWVVECFEYPSKTPPGKAPRDRIVILEDTDGDGVCDKRTVFCEGKDFPVPEERKKKGLGAFDLCTGLEVGNGGVYVGAAPYLWFIENKNDKPGKFETLLGGFGSQDTHETLNTFQWGPDGWLYGLHGIFTQSDVVSTNPSPAVNPSPQPLPRSGEGEKKLPPSLEGKGAGGLGESNVTKINGGIWRFHPKTKKFEVFAEGTSNPWGMDWRNTDGQFILACCVIPHLYHIVPGGIYKRQAGASYNPYVYSYINEICDHTFHRESGWAHAGLISLDVPHMPEKYRNSVIFGSIHGCSIKQNILKPNGSSYTASKGEDFLVSGDKNFRPINLRWGPNGDIYCIDWHDQNPCHQAEAGSWDYERGRVYRIQLKGTKMKKAEDLSQLDTESLVERFSSENPYVSRSAFRLVREQKQDLKPLSIAEPKLTMPKRIWANVLIGEDQSNSNLNHDLNDPKAYTHLVSEYSIAIREFQNDKNSVGSLIAITKGTTHPSIRREIASAAIRFESNHDVPKLIHEIFSRSEDANDPLIPHLTWIAYEKVLSKNPHEPELAWLAANAPGNPFITDHIVPKVMRRLVAFGKPEQYELCLKFVNDVKDAHAKRQALNGLVVAFSGQVIDAPKSWPALQAELRKDDSFAPMLNKLAVAFRDPEAVNRAFAVMRDGTQADSARAEAIRQLVILKPDHFQKALVTVIRQGFPDAVKIEAARGLASFDEATLPAQVASIWPNISPAVKSELVNTLASRKTWAKELLNGMKAGKIDRTFATDNTIVRIQSFNDRELNTLIESAWGRTRKTPAELQTLIDKTRSELDATPASFTRGKVVFDNQCAKCHNFDGRGQAVGPPLDGAGRDIDYLLTNVIDPNRVIGAPYFLRTATMLDGRVEQGVLAEEDDKSISLKVENGIVKKLFKKDIDGPVKVQEKSMMPEGLTAGMSPADFRDLVRYAMANPFVTHVTLNGQKVHGGVTGKIPLPKAAGEVSLSFTVNAPEKMDAKLMIGCTDDVTILNGEKIVGKVKVATVRRAAPDQEQVMVDLPKGKTTLTIKVNHKGAGEAVYLRFLDADRKLRYEGE